MRNIQVEDNLCRFDITTHTGFPNALRRALLTDVSRYAPSEIEIAQNTSSQTDEYIAHRIGLVPFELTGDPDGVISLNAKGGEVFTSDFEGDSFRTVKKVPIILLTRTQELKLNVRFIRGTGRDHARFALIGPVAYKLKEPDGVHNTRTTSLEFETINNESPLSYLLDALLELKKKIEMARLYVEQNYDGKRRLLTEQKKVTS